MDGIGEGSSGYGGDHALERLLNEAGLNQSIAEIRALIAGVNAAPTGTDPDAWLNLFDQRRLTDPLRLQLKALRDELASADRRCRRSGPCRAGRGPAVRTGPARAFRLRGAPVG